MDNKIIKVDENLNCIIPECLKKIPQYNHNVQTYTIDCPRYTQNGEDMIEMIPFVSVEKEGVSEPITEACTMPRENQEDKTRMFFEWTITRDATDTKGKLAFVICIKKTVDESIENAWHTYRNDEIEVKKGIKCLDILMHNFPSIIDGVLARIGHLEITAFSGKASDVNYEDKEKMLHTNNVQDAIEKLSGEIHKTVIDDVLSENDNASLVYGEDYQIGDLLKFTTPTEGDRDYCIECYTADSYEEKVFEDGLIEITIEDDRIQQIIVGAHTTVKRPKNTILWEIEQLKVNGSGENPNAVKYVEQELTEEQKKVARANINAADALEVKKNSEELNNESITKILSENAAAVITLGNHYEIGDVLRFTTPTTGNRDYCIEIYKTNDYEELEFSGEDIVIEIVDDSIVQIIVGAYTTVHRTRTTVLGEVRQLKETMDDLKASEVTGISAGLTGVLRTYFTNVQTILPQFAYVTEDNIGKTLIQNAKDVVAILGGEIVEPDEPIEPDNPEVTLTSITATYGGGEVTEGTSLTELTGITVTATYSDGSTANVTGYTLSGEILEGENTITVSYGGLTTTITVTGIVESGGDTTAELITDGLKAYFDYRNCVKETGSGGLHYIRATQGDGQVYSWTASAVPSGDNVGASGLNAIYAESGSTQYVFPTTFTWLGFCKNSDEKGNTLPIPNNYVATANSEPNVKGSYYNNSNTLTATDTVSLELKEHGTYTSCMVRVNENLLDIFVDGVLVASFDGNNYDGFSYWDNVYRAINNPYKQGYVVASALYEKALSDVEIMEMHAFFKTLEVA